MTAPPPTIPPVPTAALYDALAPVYDRWQAAGGTQPFSEVARAKLLPAGTPCGDTREQGRRRPRVRLVRRLRLRHRRAAARSAARAPRGGALVGHRRQRRRCWNRRAPSRMPIACTGSRARWPRRRCHRAAAARRRRLLLATRSITCPTPPALARVDARHRRRAAARWPLLSVFDATNQLGFDRWWRGNPTPGTGADWRVSIETRLRRPRSAWRRPRSPSRIARQPNPHATLSEHCFSDGEIQRGAGGGRHRRGFWASPGAPSTIDAPGKTWWIGRNRCLADPTMTPDQRVKHGPFGTSLIPPGAQDLVD